MLRYAIRRILQMIPTVFGVILITFILFNVAGGPPALLKLGKSATPRSLEDYEKQHGLNKPLFFGFWGTTRAYSRVDFDVNPGPWSTVEGVRYDDREGTILLPSGNAYTIPQALKLDAAERYRWVIRYRYAYTSTGTAALRMVHASNEVASATLVPASGWHTFVYSFQPEAGTDPRFRVVVSDGTLEVADVRLERRMAHFFDSQFLVCLRQTVGFDFGESTETNQRVSDMILGGMLPSLALTIPMFILGLLLEIVIALVCAFYRNSWIDRFFVICSVAMMSVPYLVWIIFGQYYFGYVQRWFPVWGFESVRYLVLPCIIGVTSGIGSGIRFYRTIMLDEMYRDYVRTAFAKGVSKPGVLFRHVLKNAMIPILTSVIVAIPFLYTGSLLLESFFGIPGLGNLAINAINNSDFDVIRTVVFIGALLYLGASLVTDLMYALVDPRVKLR